MKNTSDEIFDIWKLFQPPTRQGMLQGLIQTIVSSQDRRIFSVCVCVCVCVWNFPSNLYYCLLCFIFTGSLASWVECSPMVWETWVQSQLASYQRLLKWYLILSCLILSNIRYVSRVKWRNPGKGVAPSPTPRCSSYWKGSLLVAPNYGSHVLFTNKERASSCIKIADLLSFCSNESVAHFNIAQ